MDAQPLYDLSPLARMMLMGVVLALGPLAWIWMRNRQAAPAQRMAALTVLTLFLTFDLVLFGAFTRLTDSGLGCPDWPGCYGQASPLGAHAEISAAQSAQPTGPVTHRKAWIEMIHRYLATGVGVLILTLTAASWMLHRRGGTLAVSPWWPTLTLVWVCLQGAFGALTVTMKLFPAIVTLHLIGGLVLLALLCVQAARFRQAQRDEAPALVDGGRRVLLWVTTAAVTLQIALGGWVSTNYAVLACRDFPQCQGSWWPQMDFLSGFEIWRHLGMTGSGEGIPFAALTAIHYTHRLWAYVVLALMALLAWRLWRDPALARPARWVAALAAWQFGTGLSNVVFDWPLAAAVSHTGGAAALVVVLTWALANSRVDGTQADTRDVTLREARA
ncbi:MAG: COX15/CtaA family protein [Burkholderiales bacterium]|nr:COX15/CtaA family protein [Burkholderiales bacterium]